MHLSVKVPIEYPIKAIHIKVNSTIQAAKVEFIIKKKKMSGNYCTHNAGRACKRQHSKHFFIKK